MGDVEREDMSEIAEPPRKAWAAPQMVVIPIDDAEGVGPITPGADSGFGYS